LGNQIQKGGLFLIVTDQNFVESEDSPPPLLAVRGLKKHFPVRKGVLSRIRAHVYAVDGLSFSIAHGETLALVGESGCGKSTTGRIILKLVEPTSGEIVMEGQDVTHLSRHKMLPFRRQMQIIFQDPYASLTPTLPVGEIIGEPLRNFHLAGRKESKNLVLQLLDRVGLHPEDMDKYPHEFSGGQRQRIAIARAIAVRPKLMICDEPVSALDVSVRAQVINLLIDLQREYKLTYLFISHDLAVVEHISHRIAVMYLGKIVEIGTATDVLDSPLHPYTEALLSAVPIPDASSERKRRIVLKGDVPSPSNPPKGCRFQTRCPRVFGECKNVEPELLEGSLGHFVACHRRCNGGMRA
jgi:oligopeptide/dipeptide ABC transporter ATP-binding protein